MKPQLCAALIVLLAAAALSTQPAMAEDTYELSFITAKVGNTYAKGNRGVFELPDTELPLDVDQEFPVVRDARIIGLFRVDYIGRLNVWGEFLRADTGEQLKYGDTVVLPFAYFDKFRQPRVRADVKTRIVFGLPDDSVAGYWCLLNRGAKDGLQGGDEGSVRFKDEKSGTFEIMYAGPARSFGIFTPNEKIEKALLDSMTLEFPED